MEYISLIKMFQISHSCGRAETGTDRTRCRVTYRSDYRASHSLQFAHIRVARIAYFFTMDLARRETPGQPASGRETLRGAPNNHLP